jgi:hypothetical protein
MANATDNEVVQAEERMRTYLTRGLSYFDLGFYPSHDINEDRATLAEAYVKLNESLTDHAQCCVCKKWQHVEDMLRPRDLITDELCCSESCCDCYGH